MEAREAPAGEREQPVSRCRTPFCQVVTDQTRHADTKVTDGLSGEPAEMAEKWIKRQGRSINFILTGQETCRWHAVATPTKSTIAQQSVL